ncbi:MAG TPA: hypothetical protein VME23_18300 [Terracidiphilus sp.]|nr:hypothetical protein [Terracidiphilus sp.]
MTTPKEWAKVQAEKVRAKQQAIAQRHQNVSMQRDILAEDMPRAWEDLLQQFETHCKEYNDAVLPEGRLGFFRTTGNTFTIRPDALGEIVTGLLEPATNRIKIITPKARFDYLPKVVLEDTGRVELISASTHRQTCCVDIAQEVMDEALA